MTSRKRRRRCGKGVKGEIGEMNSLMTRWKTSKKGSLALRSVLGEQGDGWRTVRVMGWHAKHIAVCEATGSCSW